MLDRAQIESILPHRPPFLFVDSISAIVPGESIVGVFLVREKELFLAREGGETYLPATVLAEAMAQVGAILVLYPEENRGRTIYFRAIEEAEFLRRVLAGKRVRIEARVKKLRARFGSLAVEAYVDSDLAATGIMSFALG
ncbi:MAG: 3-hydroxyacyl-ACP dehydratase FabZ family protein [Vicinamibacteria bacterium]